MIDLTGSCRRHRAALVDFVDRGELRESAEAAFAHLERCGRCVAELETTALTITALRRLGDAIARQEPPVDAWPRLRTQIESRKTDRPWGRSAWSAHLVGVGLIGCLVASVALSGPTAVIEPSSQPQAISEAALFVAPAEEPSRRPRPAELAAASPREIQIDLGRWTGPDGLGITLSNAGARPSGPI